MVTLAEVLSSATPRGAIMGKVCLLWVFRSLENAFAAIVHVKMLSGTAHITNPNHKAHALLYKYLYILFC